MQVSPIPGVHFGMILAKFADYSVDELFPISSIGQSSRGSRKPFREQKKGQNFIPTRVPSDIIREMMLEREEELYWERESHEPPLMFRWKKSNSA
jgi:hypothetical protein